MQSIMMAELKKMTELLAVTSERKAFYLDLRLLLLKPFVLKSVKYYVLQWTLTEFSDISIAVSGTLGGTLFCGQ